MGSVVSVALGYIFGKLKNPDSTGPSSEDLRVGIINIITTLRAIASAFDTLFKRQKHAWTSAQGDATNIANIARDVAKWDDANWRHLLGTILPNSLAWLDGAIHRWADATFLKLSWLKSKQWTTVRDNAQTGFTFWKTYHNFLHAFTTKSWPDLLRWQAKRVEPQLTQLWTLNPKAQPLEWVILDKAAEYLHSQRGETDLANLTELIIDESPQRWRHVETAVLAILNANYP